jgi:protein-tyrosine phosphatase
MAAPFRVLFVCTGNICRSPMAQAMLTHRLRERLGDAHPIEVSSAGTGALAGEPMEPFAVDALTGLGVTAGAFAARDVDADILASADLVLTATRQHRSVVVTAEPSVVRRTFTIKEFARLTASLGDAPAVALDKIVDRVAAQRGFAPPVAPADDDIADPFQQPAARFAETAREIAPAVETIADLLATSAKINSP